MMLLNGPSQCMLSTTHMYRCIVESEALRDVCSQNKSSNRGFLGQTIKA